MYNNDGSSSSLEPDINPDEQEEKARLISQVLELQNTLDGRIRSLYPILLRISVVSFIISIFFHRFITTCGRCKRRKSQTKIRKPSAGTIY